jgi:steroid 5-alpha reductase family enzyme
MSALGFLALLLAVSAALAAIMAGAWLVWRVTRNSGWIDTTWTFGLGVVGAGAALIPAFHAGTVTARQILVAALVALWAMRLGLHIASRTAGISDDPRYGKMVRDWGVDASRQMFFLVEKQALVSIPLALSIVLAAWNPASGLGAQDYLGALVLIVAIAGEGVADAQLRRFRAQPDNRNRVCDVGLWGWSRHPNYFFEWFGWLAYPLIAIDLAGGYAFGFVALIGPVCMYWLLVHVSGIPPLEAHMLDRRGEAFRSYQAHTNAFFPAPPRRITATRPT